MAYSDPDCDVPLANRFSHPDVMYKGLAAGGPTKNIAQIIRDNMANFLKSTPRVSQFGLA